MTLVYIEISKMYGVSFCICILPEVRTCMSWVQNVVARWAPGWCWRDVRAITFVLAENSHFAWKLSLIIRVY